MKKSYYFLVFVLGLLTACEDKNDSLLITSTTQLTFGPDGGSQTFNIECNADWAITSDEDWLTVTPTSGSHNQEITVTVAITKNQLEENARLVIHTTDGEKVVNINVKVEGSYVKSGKFIDIRNHKSRLTLGGKAGTTDSLRVRANMAWEIKGPKWIEAWDGERWRPLSQERAVIKGKGSDNVYIRTASDNKDEDDIEDLITVLEQFTGDYKYSIYIEQLGRLRATPHQIATLSNGTAFEWICGCDVEKIYFRVTDKEIKGASIEEVRQTFDVTYPDYVNSTEMKENSVRVIETRCEDRQGNMGDYVMFNTINNMAFSKNKAYTAIMDVQQESWSKWKITTLLNDEANFYFEYASNTPNGAFAYTTPILYHIFDKNIRTTKYMHSKSGYYIWEMPFSSNEIHAMTISYDSDYNIGYICRYDKFYDADGNELFAKPLLDRIPKAMINDPSLR